jgi:hypothetical protein
MLIDDIDRYIRQRHSLGFAFRVPAYVLRQFGRFAHVRGDTAVRTQTTIEWASAAPSAPQRRERLQVVRRFALHMQAEDERYEVPPTTVFGNPQRRRRTPHIYTPDEVDALLRAAAQLTPPHRSDRSRTWRSCRCCLQAGSASPKRSRFRLTTQSVTRCWCARRNFGRVAWSHYIRRHGRGSIGTWRSASEWPRAIGRCLSRCAERGSGMRRRTARFSRSPDRQVSVPGLVCRDLACMMLDSMPGPGLCRVPVGHGPFCARSSSIRRLSIRHNPAVFFSTARWPGREKTCGIRSSRIATRFRNSGLSAGTSIRSPHISPRAGTPPRQSGHN